MKYFKYIGIISILIFSFYYTEKISNFVLEKNKLYKEIDLKKKEYEVLTVNAQIDDLYITPGLNGKEVDVKTSFFNMKSINFFNPDLLLYNEISPTVSVDQNKEKIIKRGNASKKQVSIIIENDNNLKQYFLDNKLYINILVSIDNYERYSKFEQINDYSYNYQKLDDLFNNHKNNNNLCVVDDKNIEKCKNDSKYLIEPQIINDANFINIYNNIMSGDILLIKKGTSIKNVKHLIKKLYFSDLSIVKLSKLISEKRD